jgi:hypothetical protein
MAKITPDIVDEIIASFERVGGAAYLDQLALRDPPTYCRLVAYVLPKAINVGGITEPIDLGKLMAEASARLATGSQTDDQS